MILQRSEGHGLHGPQAANVLILGMAAGHPSNKTGRTRCCEFARLLIQAVVPGLHALAVDVDADDGSVNDDPLAIVARNDA